MDSYSKLVAWLKVLLPITALGLLSTVFLLSRNIDPVAAIPLEQSEVVKRVKTQQATSTLFSGMSQSGDRISVSANTMATGANNRLATTDLVAQIDLPNSTRVVINSNKGDIELEGGPSVLEGDVVIATSTGYELTSDLLRTDLNNTALESPGPVSGLGLFGTIDAGSMRMEKRATTGNVHLVFTNGVKLVYEHNERKK